VKRLAITGATGFIGRYVLDEAVRAGFEVYALARHAPRDAASSCVWHETDLFDAAAIRAAMRAISPTHLLHLAWYAEAKLFWSGEQNLDWIESSINLMRAFAAAGGRVFVGAGSCAEYRWDGSLCREDETPLADATLYAASKNAFASVAARYCADHELRFAWGRIFFAYGPGEDPSKLLSRLGADALAGRSLLLREPNRLLDYIHVRDVARAFALLAAEDGASGPYNIGTGVGRSVASMAADVATALGIANASIIEAPVAETAPDVVADPAKLCALGWAPAIEFASGLTDLFGTGIKA